MIASSKSRSHTKPLLPIRHPARSQSPRQTFRQVLLLLTLVFVGSLLLPGRDQHGKDASGVSSADQQEKVQAQANEILAKVGNPLPSSPPSPKAQRDGKTTSQRTQGGDDDATGDDASSASSANEFPPARSHGTGRRVAGLKSDSPTSREPISHQLLVEDGVNLSAARISEEATNVGEAAAAMQGGKTGKLGSGDSASSLPLSPPSSSMAGSTLSLAGSSKSSSVDTLTKATSSDTTQSATAQVPSKEYDPRWAKYAVIVKSGNDVVEDRFPPLLATSLRGVKNLLLVGDADLRNVGNTGVDMVDVVTKVLSPVQIVKEKAVGDGLDEDGTEQDLALPAAKSEKNDKEAAHRKRNTSSAKPAGRIEDTKGWKLDAHKFLPSIREAYRQFPEVDWFLIADDDTYFFMESVHAALSNHMPSERHYFGSGNMFVGCDGVTRFGQGPTFAHGGGGIVLSRGAVQALLPNLESCIPKYFECWAGDVQLALCLRDAGIRHSDIGHGFRFYQDNPGSGKWTFPAGTHGACERPLTMHHLHTGDLDKLKSAEQLARYKAKYVAKMEDVASPKTHPWLYAATDKAGSQLVAATSEFYSPVNMGDIWKAFWVGDSRTRGQRRAIPVAASGTATGVANAVAAGNATAVLSTLDVASADKCSARCESYLGEGDQIASQNSNSTAGCLTWDYDTESRKCRLFDSLARMEPAVGWVTGAREGVEKKVGKQGLYTCEQRGL